MKRMMKKFLIGGRLIKTGISVFFTALICYSLHLPAIFAVITAIVTIEPTASDSIKKGLIRFPASAIGAAISMSLTAVLGESPLTFALSTIFTIYICHLLKLDAGILVATITGAVMIPITESHFFMAFITRLATTSIGIIMSSIVNILILPPKFSTNIEYNLNESKKTVSAFFELLAQEIVADQTSRKRKMDVLYRHLTDCIERTNQLCHYEQEEFKYHKQRTQHIRSFHFAVKQVNLLQLVAFHLGNLKYIKYDQLSFTEQERGIIKMLILSLCKTLQNSPQQKEKEANNLLKQVENIFCKYAEKEIHKKARNKEHHFSQQTIILFELISIHDALKDWEQLYRKKEKTASSYTEIL